MSYPESLEITPLSKPPKVTIRVPGSKSITNRALILAALSDPKEGSELRGVLQSEDTEVMVAALRELGYRVHADWQAETIRVRRDHLTRLVPASKADLYVANSGTSMRFLTALVSLGSGRYRLDGVTRMRERPIDDLLLALRQLGVKAYSERGDGFPPVLVKWGTLHGGTVHVRGNISSQFLSALLMVAPLAREPVTIYVDGPLVSHPYVAMTAAIMRRFGCPVESDGLTWFQTPTLPWYSGQCFDVEPDASAASYFMGAAAVAGGEVAAAGLNSKSLQGDVRFVNVLEEMGCSVGWHEQAIHVRGYRLRGADADMNAISDTVMTLAAVACFAEGPTTIRNVAHIRHKETDRLAALAAELRKVGAKVDEFPDGLRITPRPLHGAEIETYNDHRMAMSMALIGLRVPGIVIKNPSCVAKTYPRFWEDLDRLRG